MEKVKTTGYIWWTGGTEDCLGNQVRPLGIGVTIRQHLADGLPRLADRSIQTLAELTPTAYAARLAK